MPGTRQFERWVAQRERYLRRTYPGAFTQQPGLLRRAWLALRRHL